MRTFFKTVFVLTSNVVLTSGYAKTCILPFGYATYRFPPIVRKLDHSSKTNSPSFVEYEPKQNTFFRKLSSNFKNSLLEYSSNPWKFLSIPLSAAIIGYITNWVGVKMLFYPIKWTGLPLYRVDNQPLGLIGWQGIVPCKRVPMATRLVDITLTSLIKVSEIFQSLNPSKMTNLLSRDLGKTTRFLPQFIIKYFLHGTCVDIIRNAENIVELRSLVVKGLTTDAQLLGQFFQKVASKELRFLIDSGFGLGFALGILQMFQMMVYPKDWTLIVGGALVGYVTNWVALKWIFEPLNPVQWGPFVFQGMFLKRQKEVSHDFCTFLCDKVIISNNVWDTILNGPNQQAFKNIMSRNIPLSPSGINNIFLHLQKILGNIRLSHPLHSYIDKTLQLKTILISRMNLLTPLEFEKIIHPIFQEDELTLILAGAALGGLSGLLQMWMSRWQERRAIRKDIQERVSTIRLV